MPLAINGIGPVGAFGAGVENFRAALSGKAKVTPDITRVETCDGSFDLPVFRASTSSLADFVARRKLRRLDNFSRLALLGAALASADSETEIIGSRTGLIVASAHGASATTFAFLDSVIDDGDALSSPTLFSNSVHNAAASHIAEHFQITGPNLSLTQGADSLKIALITAAQWLASGRIDTVLCGAVDCYCEVLGYCWQSCKNSCKDGCRKFSKRELKTLSYGPGEGSFFLHLSRKNENSPEPKYGYLNRFIPDPDSPSITTLYGNPDITAICGNLPIPTLFHLAATIVKK